MYTTYRNIVIKSKEDLELMKEVFGEEEHTLWDYLIEEEEWPLLVYGNRTYWSWDIGDSLKGDEISVEEYIKRYTDNEKTTPTKTPHKSTGGSSEYYKVVLPQWLLDKQKENGYIMIEDLAEIMFDNDFNYTNVFKAQKRMFDLQNGGGKLGNTLDYDATKCKYYIDKQLEVFNRK